VTSSSFGSIDVERYLLCDFKKTTRVFKFLITWGVKQHNHERFLKLPLGTDFFPPIGTCYQATI